MDMLIKYIGFEEQRRTGVIFVVKRILPGPDWH